MLYWNKYNGVGHEPNIKGKRKFYDNIKDDYITKNQLLFLYHISNLVGIPQYYDMLIKYRNDENFNIDSLNASTLSDMIYNSSLAVEENKFLHKYQKEVIDKFSIEDTNRYFLTAPTSFGKTFILREILFLNQNRYRNILLVFPTIALLNENTDSMKDLIRALGSEYKIVNNVYSSIDENEKHIFILTPERVLKLLSDQQNLKIDFFFFDEVYKIELPFKN